MKKIIIPAIIVIIIIIAGVITINKINTEKAKTEFNGEKTEDNVVVNDIEFKNITRDYENGVTSIKADVYNNTKKAKSINVKIIIKDENDKEIKSMIQIIENIEPGIVKKLQTGIVGNYVEIYKVEFKLISDKEIEAMNK